MGPMLDCPTGLAATVFAALMGGDTVFWRVLSGGDASPDQALFDGTRHRVAIQAP
jgi:hypothetical protein